MRIPLSSVRLVLAHLTTTKYSDLALAPVGQAYAPMLTSKLAEIDGLPPELKAEPFRDELDQSDDLHDDFHAASQGAMDASMICPSVSKDDKVFLGEVRTVFVPDAFERASSYAKEADRARERRTKLPAYEAKLKAWPVAPGQSLYDWIEGSIAAGEKLHTLLEQRSEILSKSRREAMQLRSQALGLLRDLRRGIRSAVQQDAALPRDLETRLFSYMDTLDAMVRSKPAETPETPETPETK